MPVRNLRNLRVARNLTLNEVGEKIGVHPGRISRIERGESPSWDLANDLARFYGVTLDEAFEPSHQAATAQKNVNDEKRHTLSDIQGNRL